MKERSVVVVGGGAAGFFAAITCAEANPQAQVTILERSTQVLGKVKISGGGRCNVTHSCFDPAQLVGYYPRGHKALRGPFSRFQPRDTIRWFEEHDVLLKTEKDGRLFPTTDSSQTIVDCLVSAAQRAGVQIRKQVLIKEVTQERSGFVLQIDGGMIEKADVVILATGSNPDAWRWVKSLGHKLQKPVPSLFTVTVKDPRLEGLAGLAVARAGVKLAAFGIRQEGPVMITHWGLSGPGVLKLSAWGARELHDSHYQADLDVDWLPTLSSEKLETDLKTMRSTFQSRVAHSTNPTDLPKRLWIRLMEVSGIPAMHKWTEVSNEKLLAFCGELKRGRYRITGKSTFKEEFVTCGGVNQDEVDFRTMESKKVPGLYFAGEVLDIDGLTGGFNFQNAWTTGWLAGRAAAGLNP